MGCVRMCIIYVKKRVATLNNVESYAYLKLYQSESNAAAPKPGQNEAIPCWTIRFSTIFENRKNANR
jgi:hypothetical protein